MRFLEWGSTVHSTVASCATSLCGDVLGEPRRRRAILMDAAFLAATSNGSIDDWLTCGGTCPFYNVGTNWGSSRTDDSTTAWIDVLIAPRRPRRLPPPLALPPSRAAYTRRLQPAAPAPAAAHVGARRRRAARATRAPRAARALDVRMPLRYLRFNLRLFAAFALVALLLLPVYRLDPRTAATRARGRTRRRSRRRSRRTRRRPAVAPPPGLPPLTPSSPPNPPSPPPPPPIPPSCESAAALFGRRVAVPHASAAAKRGSGRRGST